MSNVRDVDGAPYSTRVRRELGAPPPAAERRERPRIARYVIAVLGVLALLAIGYVVWRTYGGEGPSAPPVGRPPVAVVVASATARVWQTQVSAVGTLVAVQGVQVTSEVPGIVRTIHFQSGTSVRTGTLLVELDAAADRARLASLVAQLEQARADDTRNRRLVERGLISTAEAEQSATTVETLAAQRLRPILMTTMATLFGMVPLWFAGGPGAESRFAIGFVLGAGMAIGTVFTLFVVPALYTVIAKAHHDRTPADIVAATSSTGM